MIGTDKHQCNHQHRKTDRNGYLWIITNVTINVGKQIGADIYG